MTSSVVTSLAVTPKADNNKGVGSNVVLIAAGAGVAQVITPAQPQNAVSVINSTANYIRVTYTLAVGINATGAAATRVRLVMPGIIDNLDLGATDGNSAADVILPITSVSVVAVNTPAATSEVGTLAVATAATAGIVVLNWASA